MNNVISVIYQAVNAKFPTSQTSALLRSGRIKAEIVEEKEAVLYVQMQYIADKLLENIPNTLKAVQTAFPNVTNVRIVEGNAGFLEEIATEKAARAVEDEKHEQERAKREEADRIDRQNEMIKDSNLPDISRKTHTFDTFKLLDGNREAYRISREFAYCAIGDENDNYDYPNSGRHFFLTLTGAPGTGKTHLAFAIGWYNLLNEIYVRYFQVERFMDGLRSSFNSNREAQNYDRLMKDSESVEVLILDDIGAQKRTEWETAKLDSLIDYRYEHQLDTVFTTNLDIKDLSPRVASRLSEGNVVKLETPDFRRVKAIQREKRLRKVEK